MLVICSCTENRHSFFISAVYTPGIVEYNVGDKDMYSEYIEHYKQEIKSNRLPDRIYGMTPKDYAIMYDVLSSPKEETTKRIMPAPIVIKFGSNLYVIGDNRVVEANGKTYLISEYEDYQIKCLVHYYDNFYGEYLLYMKEIRKYGVPANHLYIPFDPNRRPKLTAKVLLLG